LSFEISKLLSLAKRNDEKSCNSNNEITLLKPSAATFSGELLKIIIKEKKNGKKKIKNLKKTKKY